MFSKVLSKPDEINVRKFAYKSQPINKYQIIFNDLLVISH